MTIGLERLLRHMAWANQLTIEHLATLPEAALKSLPQIQSGLSLRLLIT